jgi:hypothetical protein
MVIELTDLSNKCIKEMKENEEPKMTTEDSKKFYSATHCSICNGCFKDGEMRCRDYDDHDHRTGNFRGATHQKCKF